MPLFMTTHTHAPTPLHMKTCPVKEKKRRERIGKQGKTKGSKKRVMRKGLRKRLESSLRSEIGKKRVGRPEKSVNK